MSLSAFDFCSLDLPITQVIEPLRQQLLEHDEAILEAEPGAGKTTCVPLALVDQPWLHQQKILLLEPRRLAAKHAAARMASLLNEPLGQTVGYRIRHEQKVSDQTRIEVITEGILVRMLQDDPSLEGVGLIIFDEFHERNLDSDLALALSLESREFLRDEHPLKLLIMSATLDHAPLEKLLNCSSLFCPGRTFPVDIHYQNLSLKQEEVLPQLAKSVIHALHSHTGDVLVFLPGQKEINQLLDKLQGPLSNDVELLPLYGKLDFKAQQAVLNDQNKSTRKVILASAIAQTSLTIPGIKIVIDSGLSREAKFDANTGLTRLHTRKVSQAESIQRSGRAGRTSQGICYRWWSEDAQNRLMDQAQPQITTADLTNLALELAKWGASHHQDLGWLTPIPEGHWQQAITLLKELGALEPQEALKLTKVGEAMSVFAASARIARLLCAGISIQSETFCSRVAALIMEADNKHNNVDLSEQLATFSSNKNKPLGKTQQQLRQQMNKVNSALVDHLQKTSMKLTLSESESLAYLLACAFPDRIAKQQSLNSSAQWQDYKLANGRLAQLHKSQPLAQAEFIIALETGGNAKFNKDQIFLANALDKALFKQALKSLTHIKEEASWPKNSERLLSNQDTMVGSLCIESKRLEQVSEEAQVSACCQHIRSLGLHLLNWDSAATRMRERLAFVSQLTNTSDISCAPQLAQFH